MSTQCDPPFRDYIVLETLLVGPGHCNPTSRSRGILRPCAPWVVNGTRFFASRSEKSKTRHCITFRAAGGRTQIEPSAEDRVHLTQFAFRSRKSCKSRSRPAAVTYRIATLRQPIVPRGGRALIAEQKI